MCIGRVGNGEVAAWGGWVDRPSRRDEWLRLARDHRDMGMHVVDEPDWHESRFERVDLHGSTFRDCGLSGVRIVDCMLDDVCLAGAVRNLVVNDVDVTAFVEAELDRRVPERRLAREARSADEIRAAWEAIVVAWADTVLHAREHLTEEQLHERVAGEWSFAETHRHLLFASDAWIGSSVLDEAEPYHRLGYPADGYPPDDAATIGLDLAATASFDDVLSARRARQERIGELIAGLSDADLERQCPRKPAPDYPDRTHTVRQCVGVVLREEAEHLRYARRDLAALGVAGVSG